MSRDKVKKKAKQKGQVAAGTVAASAVMCAVCWPIGVIGLGLAGWAGYDWFKYRARNGLRF